MKIGNGSVLFCNNTKWDWKGKERKALILFDLCFLLWNGSNLMLEVMNECRMKEKRMISSHS